MREIFSMVLKKYKKLKLVQENTFMLTCKCKITVNIALHITNFLVKV